MKDLVEAKVKAEQAIHSEEVAKHILTRHIRETEIVSPYRHIKNVLFIVSLEAKNNLTYHQMLLGLHGDCEEEDVLLAIANKDKLIKELLIHEVDNTLYPKLTKTLNEAIAKACYEYAAHESSKILESINKDKPPQ